MLQKWTLLPRGYQIARSAAIKWFRVNRSKRFSVCVYLVFKLQRASLSFYPVGSLTIIQYNPISEIAL